MEDHKSWLALVQPRSGKARAPFLAREHPQVLCSCLQQGRAGSLHSAICCSAPACSMQSQHGHPPQALLPLQEKITQRTTLIFPNSDILALPLLFRMDILRLHRIYPIQRIQQVDRAALGFDISNKTIYQTKIREC